MPIVLPKLTTEYLKEKITTNKEVIYKVYEIRMKQLSYLNWK